MEEPRSQDFFLGEATNWPEINVLRKLQILNPRKSHDALDFQHKFDIFAFILTGSIKIT